MPAAGQHINQYHKNKKLLTIPEFNIDNTKFVDWVITILFYAAVHLIEKELAAIEIHTTKHIEREKAFNRASHLKPIFQDYCALSMASRKSRYDCHNYKNKDAKFLQGVLLNVEKHLGVVS